MELPKSAMVELCVSMIAEGRTPGDDITAYYEHLQYHPLRFSLFISDRQTGKTGGLAMAIDACAVHAGEDTDEGLPPPDEAMLDYELFNLVFLNEHNGENVLKFRMYVHVRLRPQEDGESMQLLVVPQTFELVHYDSDLARSKVIFCSGSAAIVEWSKF